MVASLEKALPSVHFDIASVLGTAAVSTPAELAALLLADLERLNEPIALVLDDYHHIQDRSIHELIETVVRHAPTHVHLVTANLYFESSTILSTSKAHYSFLLVQSYLYLLLTTSAANECATTIEKWLHDLGTRIRQDGGSETQLVLGALVGMAALQRGDRSQARKWIQESTVTRNGALPSLRCMIWIRRLLADRSPQSLALAQTAAEKMIENNMGTMKIPVVNVRPVLRNLLQKSRY